MRVTSTVHPLFGRLLRARGFMRRGGVVLLVVDLPDGSPGTIHADATDVFGGPVAGPAGTVLSVQGLRRLRQLMTVLGPVAKKRGRPQAGK